MSSDALQKYQKILGPKINLNILEEINSKMDKEGEKDEIELGDSLLTSETLPAELPQLNSDELVPETSEIQFSSFGNNILNKLESVLDRNSIILPSDSNKWQKISEGDIFEIYESSQKILTTKHYEKANFEKCSFTWDFFKFKGDLNILQVTKLLDTKITEVLKKKNLIECMSEKRSANAQDVWIEINSMAKRAHLEPYEEYVDDTTKFLVRIEA